MILDIDKVFSAEELASMRGQDQNRQAGSSGGLRKPAGDAALARVP
jgi:hypothetical protein